MSRSRNPFLAEPVGPPRFGRLVLRRNFLDPPDYYTGSDDEPWDDDLGKARLYGGVDDLDRSLHGLARRELAHLGEATYRLEVEVTVLGEATHEGVAGYLRDALKTRLDTDTHGPGPGLGTLVLVRADPGSLRAEAGSEHDAPNSGKANRP